MPRKVICWSVLNLLLVCGIGVLCAQQAQQEPAGYSYVHMLYGTGIVTHIGDPDEVPIQENMPILSGDTIAMRSGVARINLSDGSHVFVGEGTAVTFEKIADSPDTDGTTTILYVKSSR
jgi:hypothetical protein